MNWLALGVLLALVMFWAVGAYNRLMRLRSEMLRQWGTVDTVWLKWLMRFQGAVSARQILAWASEADDLQALQDGSDALIEALAEARQQALDEGSLQKLMARHEALMDCIDAVALRVPDTVRPHLLSAQAKILQNIPLALLPYHTAVEAYNLALSQAPARWLAQGLRMRPGLLLLWPARSSEALS
jgi:LemA protein